MSAAYPSSDLDEILALQLAIAWAGETPGGEQRRLGWWKTDLVDAEGGGDLWTRLLPRTRRWAGLDAARRAARLVDERARRGHARADEMLTLFHFGFELDELLDERLSQHKLDALPPEQVLPLLSILGQPFEPAILTQRLAASDDDRSFKVIPGARQLKSSPDESMLARAKRLTAAMLTEPPATYPLPFLYAEARRAAR